MKSDRRAKKTTKTSTSLKKHSTEFKKVVTLLKINTEEGFLHIDTQLLVVAFNDQFEKQILKFSKHGLAKGESILTYFEDDKVAHVQDMCLSALGGDATVDEMEISSSGQPNLILSFKYKPAYDEQEGINGVFISLKDITETKLAKRQLEIAHHRLLFHLENSPLGYIEWDNELHVKSWSKRSEEIFGWNEQEFMSMRKDGYSQVYKDDLAWVSETARQLISGNVESNTLQHRNYTKDGNVIWCEWFNSILRDQNGKVITIMSLVQDITKRKEAEEHRIHHERRFKSLIENSSDIIIVLNNDGTPQYISPSIKRVLGYTEDQMMTSQLSSILHADDRNGFEKILQELEKGPQIPFAGTEIRAFHQDGSLRWLEPTYTNIRHDSAIAGIVINFRDTTERKASQEKNTFQALLLESVGQAVVATDLKRDVQYWNYGAEKMFGWSSEEAIGKNIDDLTPTRLTREETLDIMQDLLNGKVWSGELVVQRKDGISFSAFITKSTIYDREGRLTGIITVSSDVTERKRNEENIKKSAASINAIFESAIEGFVLIDKNLTISHFNSVAKKTIMLNIDRNVRIGDNILDYIDDSRRQEIRDLIEKALQGEIIQYDRCYTREDDNTYWFQFSLTPVWMDNIITGVCIAANDITNRKIAEEKLERNERRFRALIENGLDAVAILSGDGKAIYFSPSIKSVLGYDEGEIMQLNLFSLVHPDDFSIVQEAVARVRVENGIPIEGYTFRLRHKNGSWHWYEFTITNMLHDPSIRGIINNFRDVTERIISEQQREFDNNNLNALINNTNDLMWSLDRDYKLIICNKAFKELVERISGGSIGKGDNILATAFNVEVLELYKKFYDRAFEGETFTQIVHLTTPFEIWSEISFYPIYQGKTVIGTACYSRDITEKRKSEQKIIESEERYRQIVETAQEGIWLVDESFNAILANKKLCEILEYSMEEILGKPSSAFMDEESKQNWIKSRERRVQGLFESSDDIKYITKSGKQIWARVSSAPIFDQAGKFKGGLGMMTDVTNRKNAELKTQDLIGRLQSQNKNLQQFAYILSHNLRAPIAKLQGLVSLINKDSVSHSDNVDLIKSVGEEVIHLDAVVKDMNSIITLRDAKNEKWEYVSFEAALRDIEEQLKNEITESYARITTNFNQLEGMMTVKSHFTSILCNLLSNAIKYRVQGLPPKIHLQFSEDDKFICLSVKDNGMGIDLVKYGEKIFGLYKRFHGESIPGKGIGLNLVKAHAESLGGKVEVESTVNVGTTFRIFFPKQDSEKREVKYIFLIDDDRLSNSLNSKMIAKSRTNAHVKTYSNATEALDRLRQLSVSAIDEFPDLIFLDINMPTMDGWEFLDEFEKLPLPAVKRCRICMLSSSIDPSDIAKSRCYKSVYKFISKPLTAEQLTEFFTTNI